MYRGRSKNKHSNCFQSVFTKESLQHLLPEVGREMPLPIDVDGSLFLGMCSVSERSLDLSLPS